MKSTTQKIPEQLIYEIDKGKIIRYQGYQDVVKGTMGSSFIQSLIISRLFLLIGKSLHSDFEMLTSEVSLKLGKNTMRAADIAIYEKSALKEIKDINKSLEIAPKYVIEIDIKASKDDIEDSTSYYHGKTDQLLAFGVEYVIWIFTGSKKIMIAQKGKSKWETMNWDETFNVVENIAINIETLIK